MIETISGILLILLPLSAILGVIITVVAYRLPPSMDEERIDL